jgi:hypothetical protein
MHDPELDVLHACDAPLCCNPFSMKHLFSGTQQENMVDMESKGRHPRTGGTGRAKMTPGLAEAIRTAHGAGIGVLCLARVCNTGPPVISAIVNGRTWVGGERVLTVGKAGEIRARLAKGERGIDLAREFRVSPPAISRIRHGLTWKE